MIYIKLVEITRSRLSQMFYKIFFKKIHKIYRKGTVLESLLNEETDDLQLY